MICDEINALLRYALEKGLIDPCDEIWARNRLLDILGLDGFEPAGEKAGEDLETILKAILDDAAARGLIDGGITSRDLMDTRLMGVLTPRPSAVIGTFRALFDAEAKAATDWYYRFSCDTDYIRRYRIAKDRKWKAATEYGELDVTINLSKPEKDPRAIAAARSAKPAGYPKCQLCREAEGYAGRADYPARENHRVIPIRLAGEDWFLQYSPYVYYNEHCIALCAEHRPMKIDRAAFRRLLDFVTLFPHYFIGSNADLPIVGGSILSHDHFQGGRYEFAMARAEVEKELRFPGFEDVAAGIVRWPMSVIRLRSADSGRLVELADRILGAWRAYSDPEASIFAETDGEMHNTITPIARRRGEDFEFDLVLRNNLTTEEHPLGLFHPHAELHHIKKENIGLIEVMGLAVLPARLKGELGGLGRRLAADGKARALGRRAEKEVRLHAGERRDDPAEGGRRGVQDRARARGRVQARRGGTAGLSPLRGERVVSFFPRSGARKPAHTENTGEAAGLPRVLRIKVRKSSISHQRDGAVVGILDDGLYHGLVAVSFADLHGDVVAHPAAQHGLPEGRFLADQTLARVAAHGGHDADHLGLVVLRHVDLHAVEQADLVLAGAVGDHAGGLDHALEIAHAADVLALGLLGGLVFVILAEIPEGAGALDLLEDAGVQLETPVVQLLLHLADILARQFVVHPIRSLQVDADRGEAVLVELVEIVVHAVLQLGVVLRLAVLEPEIAPGQLLGQDVEEHGVLVIGDRLVDAALLVGLRGEDVALPALGQRAHARARREREELFLQQVVILKAVRAAAGVQDPVADVDQIQQPAVFLFGQIDVQRDPSFGVCVLHIIYLL